MRPQSVIEKLIGGFEGTAMSDKIQVRYKGTIHTRRLLITWKCAMPCSDPALWIGGVHFIISSCHLGTDK